MPWGVAAPAPSQLGDLADHAAYRAGCGRDHHGLAPLGRAYVEQADVRRNARHPRRTEVGAQGDALRLHPSQAGAVRNRMRLPAEWADHLVALGKGGVARAQHLAHGSAHHDLADLHRLRVGPARVHAHAHVRIERQPEAAHQQLSLARLGHGGLDQPEVRFLGLTRRAARQHYLETMHARTIHRSAARSDGGSLRAARSGRLAPGGSLRAARARR